MSLERLYAEVDREDPIPRQDLHENFNTHFNSKFRPIMQNTDASLSDVLGLMSPEPELDGQPQSPVVDFLERSGVILQSEGQYESTPTAEVFREGEPTFALGVALMEQIGDAILDPEGIVSFNTLSDLTEEFKPPTVEMLQVKGGVLDEIRIPNIIANRRVITGNRYVEPILEELSLHDNELLKMVETAENAEIRRLNFSVDESDDEVRKIAYGIPITDEARGSSMYTMQAMMEFQTQVAMKIEQGIVNQMLVKIGTGATAHSTGSGVLSAETMAKLFTVIKRGPLNTIIGGINAIPRIRAGNIYHETQMYPDTPNMSASMYNRYRMPMMLFFGRKDNADVSTLNANGNQALGFNRNMTIRYIVSRQQRAVERYREAVNQRDVTQYSLRYTHKLMPDAADTRLLITTAA